jgi:hypothetical protein
MFFRKWGDRWHTFKLQHLFMVRLLSKLKVEGKFLSLIKDTMKTTATIIARD